MESSTTVAATPAVNLIRQAFDDFSAGHVMSLVNLCADDVAFAEYSNPHVKPSGYFYGKEGVLDYFQQVNEYIRFTLFEVKEFIGEGERVIVLGHHAGVVKSTGKSFACDFCMRFTVRDGKIRDYYGYEDSYQLAQAFM